MDVLAELCPLVVIKDGAQGAYAGARRHVTYASAIPVTPVDTTGAGDCFNAGFLAAWLDGLPLDECLRWGNVVGGLSTLSRGGSVRTVTRSDVEAWLRPKE
jgi:sugar/nucleoside kinase (ribokinase family)